MRQKKAGGTQKEKEMGLIRRRLTVMGCREGEKKKKKGEGSSQLNIRRAIEGVLPDQLIDREKKGEE